MPGIVGFVTDDPDPNTGRATLSRMVGTMLHDTSYVWGTYAVPEQGCYVGWIDHAHSSGASNPLVAADGDCILVFAGEHFDHHRAGNGSHSPGHSAQSLLHLREEHGEEFDDFIRHLNGWFAGVLIDRRSRTVTLFNDRFGMHRVHVHEAPHCFSFASEAKALLSTRPGSRTLDSESLGQFLAFGTVFNNRTLFKDIALLPGGSIWTIPAPSDIRKRQYFTPAMWSDQPLLDASQFETAFVKTMSDVLPTYFRSP
ncbi:MAG: hypothetical protein AB7F99_17880, partial [Vicinamibacterales bacterium]